MADITRRDLARTGIAVALTAAVSPDALAAPADDLAYLDPELRAIVRPFLPILAAAPKLSAETLAEKRQSRPGDGLIPPPLQSPAFEKKVVKRLGDGGEIIVYVINARPGTSRPAILHMHGGGYVMGDAYSGISALQGIAAELDCAVVTVEYRLAPETNYAGSIEDNYSSLRWLHDNAAALGVDVKRIAVMGESAGGGHAALLALTARDRGEVKLAAQILIYPMLDDRTGVTRTPAEPIGKLVWTPSDNRFGWNAFLGQKPGTAKVPARAVPARYADLSGLPPTFIGVGAIDLFVDEDIEYARRLIAAGVPTDLVVIPGAFHGFDIVGPKTGPGKRMMTGKIDALRRAFAVPG